MISMQQFRRMEDFMEVLDEMKSDSRTLGERSTRDNYDKFFFHLETRCFSASGQLIYP